MASSRRDTTSVLRSSKEWEVQMPPVKRSMVQGKMLPTFKGTVAFLHTRSRRISIEIRSPADAPDLNDDEVVLGERDFCRLQVWRRPNEGKHHLHQHVDDDETKEWVEHSHCPLEDIHVLRSLGRICEISYGAGDDRVIRDLAFASRDELKIFCSTVESMAQLLHERAQRRVQEYQKEHVAKQENQVNIEEDHMINILVEIVSALDLPIADIVSSDPYVVVKMGGHKVHETDMIPKTLNPIWTYETGSLFVISMTPEEFFGCTGGMGFYVKDFDTFSSDDCLGRVFVQLNDLLEGKGERVEYPLEECEAEKAKLVLRYKPASQDDLDFMRLDLRSSKAIGTFSKESFLPPKPHRKVFVKKRKDTLNKIKIKKKIEPKFQVKPCPDPDHPNETRWMTKKEIQEEAVKPSKNWVEASSGTLGKVYVEVIGCDGLPNLDLLSVKPGDRTDTFVCLVYEDCIVNTDVINDCLSPRWMPWSQRAFVFNMSHPSSQLVVGVFNHNLYTPVEPVLPGSLHQPIGRVLVDLTAGHLHTEYTLCYQLYRRDIASSEKRQPNGTITLRIRIEVPDTRKALLVGATPPKQVYSSVPKQIDFDVAHYTVAGEFNPNQFSMETFVVYTEELQSYRKMIPYLKQAAFSVWMWRGHYPLHLPCPTFAANPESAGHGFFKRHSKQVTVRLPLHSITAFAWGVSIVRDYNRVPSFLVFSVGWILLATMEHVLKHPSPWHGTKTYSEMLLAFLLQRGSHGEKVEANKNLEEIEAYEARIAEREKQELEDKKKEQEQAQKIAFEMQKSGDDVEVDIATKKEGGFDVVMSTVSPMIWLKPYLFPIQIQLGQKVVALRIIKSIVLWQENFYAFWTVTASFLLCILFYWIPWDFLIHWTLKIFVWTVLGPWAMLLDYFYFRSREDMTNEEKEEELSRRLQSKYNKVVEQATHRQIKKERAYKLQSMKSSMFGSYLLRIPRFRENLHPDFPLPSSSATPCDDSFGDSVNIVDRKYGQHLEGDMIPKRHVQLRELKRTESTKTDSERSPLLKKGLKKVYGIRKSKVP